MPFEVEDKSDRFVVHFTDKKILDQSQIDEVGENLLELCDRATLEGRKVIVDFQGVQFVSSAMIKKLLILHQLAQQRKVDFQLANLEHGVREVFRILRLNQVFRFVEDDEQKA